VPSNGESIVEEYIIDVVSQELHTSLSSPFEKKSKIGRE
jgi:hypothetical protein